MGCTHFDGSARAPAPPMRDLAKGAFVEFLAMLLFVYFGCGSAASNAHWDPAGEWDSASVTIIAFQFGLGITVLAYATAHTSGGHINCAVTLALTIVGSCHPLRAIAYVVAQLLGSIAGAALLLATTSPSSDRTGGLGSNGRQTADVTIGNALIAEIMGTALLCFVVLESAVNGEAVTTEGESMIPGNKQNLAPIPIGLAVFMAHVLCIPITGCSINPTRSFGPAVVSGTWSDHWIWWVGPLSGAALASLVWLVLKKFDGKRSPAEEAMTTTGESPKNYPITQFQFDGKSSPAAEESTTKPTTKSPTSASDKGKGVDLPPPQVDKLAGVAV